MRNKISESVLVDRVNLRVLLVFLQFLCLVLVARDGHALDDGRAGMVYFNYEFGHVERSKKSFGAGFGHAGRSMLGVEGGAPNWGRDIFDLRYSFTNIERVVSLNGIPISAVDMSDYGVRNYSGRLPEIELDKRVLDDIERERPQLPESSFLEEIDFGTREIEFGEGEQVAFWPAVLRIFGGVARSGARAATRSSRSAASRSSKRSSRNDRDRDDRGKWLDRASDVADMFGGSKPASAGGRGGSSSGRAAGSYAGGGHSNGQDGTGERQSQRKTASMVSTVVTLAVLIAVAKALAKEQPSSSR